MPPESYGIRRVQSDYIQACIDADRPLDSVQESLLEQTVKNTIRWRREQRRTLESQLMDKNVIRDECERLEMDLTFWPTRLINLVREYKTYRDASIPLEEYPTDAQALELHKDAVNLLNASTKMDPFRDVTVGVRNLRERMRPRSPGLTYQGFKLLHAYLYTRELVNQKIALLPMALR